MFAFMLALILIFLVLAAQFESFKDPLIVMGTVPLALTGALVFMWYFDITMNIFRPDRDNHAYRSSFEKTVSYCGIRKPRGKMPAWQT